MLKELSAKYDAKKAELVANETYTQVCEGVAVFARLGARFVL